MISVFRKNDVVNIFLLLPYAILLRLFSLIYPNAYVPTSLDTVVSDWIFSVISAPLAQSVAAILLVFAQAIIINVLANNHRLHRQPTALGGMFYILLASCIPEFQQLTPALIGMTFILIATLNIFRTYNLSHAVSNIFNAALATSAAAIIYMPYVFAIIAIFIGLAMIRNFRMTERLQFLIGYSVLIWIVGSLLFFFDLLSWNFGYHIKFPGIIKVYSFSSLTSLWNLGILGLLILLALFNYYNFMKKKGIDIRKKIDFFYWLMLCSLLSIFMFEDLGYQHYYFVLTSLAVFFSMTILLIRNAALAELLHIFMLIGIFYYQFS